MHTPHQSLLLVIGLNVIISVVGRGIDPHEYFGQDEVYDDYDEEFSNGDKEGNWPVIYSEGNGDRDLEMSLATTSERLIQRIGVTHSNVTIIENVDRTSHMDARGSNIDIHGLLNENKDLDDTSDTLIENKINAQDMNVKPWKIEDIKNPEDRKDFLNEKMRGLHNGMDSVVEILKEISGNLGCKNAGICRPPFEKVRSGECLYMNLDNRLTWQAAREYCQSLGADLAEPVIGQDLEYIMRLSGTAMIHMGRDRLWVGASDRVEEGVWRWVSRRPVAKNIGWTVDHPRDITGKEDCMAMIFSNPPIVEALSCATRKSFICQEHI